MAFLNNHMKNHGNTKNLDLEYSGVSLRLFLIKSQVSMIWQILGLYLYQICLKEDFVLKYIIDAVYLDNHLEPF